MIKQPKRSVQHKPSRDERKKTKDLQDLKAENRMLRKQLARMRKEAQKPEIVKYEDTAVLQPEFEAEKCPHCNSVDLRSMTTPDGTVLVICRTCDKRTATKKAE